MFLEELVKGHRIIGNLYKNQGKLAEAEQMYERALQGTEEALDHKTAQTYSPALNNLENMDVLYARQGENSKARAMHSRALFGR